MTLTNILIVLQSLFEGAALAKSKGTGAINNPVLTSEELDVTPTGGWGDDDLGFDEDNVAEKEGGGSAAEAGKLQCSIGNLTLTIHSDRQT